MERASKAARLYYKVVEPVMGYPRHREYLAQLAVGVDCWLVARMLGELHDSIAGERVCIIFPGHESPGDCRILGAPESAVLYSLESGKRLDYITGDLDASLRLVGHYTTAARFRLIHLHGDNIERVKSLSTSIAPFIPTTQVDPTGCVVNLGGFTDGDRAIMVAMVMGASEVIVKPLPGRIRGEHKDYKDTWSKALKLELGLRLVDEAARLLGYRVYVDGEARIYTVK